MLRVQNFQCMNLGLRIQDEYIGPYSVLICLHRNYTWLKEIYWILDGDALYLLGWGSQDVQSVLSSSDPA